MIFFPLILACSSSEIIAFPSKLDFGEINFIDSPPPEGFNAQDVELKNVGSSDALISLVSADNTRLCLDGIQEVPLELGTLASDESYFLRVGVCDYIEENSERDSEINGTLSFEVDGQDGLEVPWSFIPRIIQEQ